MKENFKKGTYEILINDNPELKTITDGRIYKQFGVDMSSKYRSVTHIPTKTHIGDYIRTLAEIKDLIDTLLQIEINWDTTEPEYFMSLGDEKIKKIISKIL